MRIKYLFTIAVAGIASLSCCAQNIVIKSHDTHIAVFWTDCDAG